MTDKASVPGRLAAVHAGDDVEAAALELQPHDDDPVKLSRNVVQVMQMLHLYQAEVARILGLRCGDVASLAQARSLLEPQTHAWQQACKLVRCYGALHKVCRGDSVAMYHWLHRALPALGDTPHRLMVDEHALGVVVACLENTQTGPEHR